MFGLSSLKKPEKVKVQASNNFINMISEAKKKAEQNYEKTHEDYDLILSIALKNLKDLVDNFNKDSFLGALDNLEKAQELKSNKIEPYFYLSWLFLLADEIDLATKYMGVVNKLEPSFFGLDVLKENISKIQLIDIKNKNTDTSNNVAINDSKNIKQPETKIQNSTDEQKVTMKPMVKRVTSAYSAYGNKF